MSQTIEQLQAEEMTLEILSLFPRQGEWTEEAYFSLPETNRIIELSRGRLIITPAPTTQHQDISNKLHLLIGNFVLSNKLGKACYSPLDVRLWEGTIRQPDIVYMSNEHKDRITEKYWGVPDLVMEITSEGTDKQDRIDKFYEYAKAGILEYWIVDPFRQTIETFALEKGAHVMFGKWGIGEVANSKILAGFQISVNNVFGEF